MRSAKGEKGLAQFAQDVAFPGVQRLGHEPTAREIAEYDLDELTAIFSKPPDRDSLLKVRETKQRMKAAVKAASATKA